jgi:nitroimidazol reductase NimA-like FMN-containing flavoprotein (pyridoxamine 5'-phosphate oxidase superfamily)
MTTVRKPPPSSRGPRIVTLTRRQIVSMLKRHHVGRIAFMKTDRQIELHPVHYVFANGAIYGRTSFGAKYVAWLHRPYVAFEIDEVAGPFDWKSVVVHGTVYVLTDRGAKAERDDFREATAAIRKLLPLAFTARDPTPYRQVIFRIEPHEMTGRTASTR